MCMFDEKVIFPPLPEDYGYKMLKFRKDGKLYSPCYDTHTPREIGTRYEAISLHDGFHYFPSLAIAKKYVDSGYLMFFEESAIVRCKFETVTHEGQDESLIFCHLRDAPSRMSRFMTPLRVVELHDRKGLVKKARKQAKGAKP